VDECLFKIGSNIFSIDAFEISLDGNKEICLTTKNTTSEKWALKPDIMEMKSLLSEMKNEITKMNTEIYKIKELLKKTEVCARRNGGKVIYCNDLSRIDSTCIRGENTIVLECKC
jgi:hypothetical protein